jgi:hypothetical protein
MSSTSKISSDFGGMAGGRPASPYASWYGMNKRRRPPTRMPSNPESQPAITRLAP